jgi:hypothetical protein
MHESLFSFQVYIESEKTIRPTLLSKNNIFKLTSQAIFRVSSTKTVFVIIVTNTV